MMAKKKKNGTKRLLYILGSVMLTLVVILLVGKKNGWIGGEKGLEVTFGKVEKGEIVEKVSASGKIQPEVEVKISPDVPGEITELHIQEGDSVTKGQLLLKIRPDNYQSAVSQAQASLNTQKANLAQAKARIAQNQAQYLQSKTDFDRNEDLYKQGVISQQEYQTSKTNMEVAKSNLEAAEQNVEASRFTVQNAQASLQQAHENLSLTSVYAPMNGIVSKLVIEKGERVVGTSQMQGTEMLRIAELHNMEVRVDVNENDIIRVTLGDTVLIDVDAYADEDFRGIVTAIANSANDLGITSDAVTEFEVKIRVLGASYEHLVSQRRRYPFRPGMTASVEIMTERKKNILTVPLSAVTTRNSKDLEEQESENTDTEKNTDNKEVSKDELKEVVFINDNGTAKMIEVKTGINDFDHMEIIEGISEGDEVVTGPFRILSKQIEDGSTLKKKTDRKKRRGGK